MLYMDFKQTILKICGVPTNELCKNINDFITLFNNRNTQLNEILVDINKFLKKVEAESNSEVSKLYKQHYIKNYSLDYFINMNFATNNFTTTLDLTRDYKTLTEFNQKYCIPSKVVFVQAALSKIIAKSNVCSTIDIEHLNRILREIDKNINLLKKFHTETKGNPKLLIQYLYSEIRNDLDKLNIKKETLDKNETDRLSKFFNSDIIYYIRIINTINQFSSYYNELYQKILNNINTDDIEEFENTNEKFNELKKIFDEHKIFIENVKKLEKEAIERINYVELLTKDFEKCRTKFNEITMIFTRNVLFTSPLGNLTIIKPFNSDYNKIKNIEDDINIIETDLLDRTRLIIDVEALNKLKDRIKKVHYINTQISELTNKREDSYTKIKFDINEDILKLNTIIDKIFSNTLYIQLQNSPIQSVKDKINQCKINELQSVYNDLNSLGANQTNKADNINIKNNLSDNTLTQDILNEFYATIIRIRNNHTNFEKCVNDAKRLLDEYNVIVQKTNDYKIKLEQIINDINTNGNDPDYLVLRNNPPNQNISDEIQKCQNDIGDTKIIPILNILGADLLNKITNLHINTHIINNTLTEDIYNTFKVQVDSIESSSNEYKQCIKNVKSLINPPINYAIDKLIAYNTIPTNTDYDLGELLLLIQTLFRHIDKKPNANWIEVKNDLINILKSEHLDYYIKKIYDIYLPDVTQRKILYNNFITLISSKYINGLNSITLSNTELKIFVDNFINHINKEINMYLNAQYHGNIINIDIIHDFINRIITYSIKPLIMEIIRSKQSASNYINYYESAENVNRSESISELFGPSVTFTSILNHIDIIKYFPKDSASSSVILMGKLKANPRKSKPSIKNSELYNQGGMVLKITWAGKPDEKAELKMYNELFKLVKYNITPNILCRIFSGELQNYGSTFHSKLPPAMRTQIEIGSRDKITLVPGLTSFININVQVTITNPGEINFWNFISGQKETSPGIWGPVDTSIKATPNQLRAVIFQIMYTLYVFEQLNIQQGDLHAGNVFINTLPKEIEICYIINDGVNNIPFRVKTDKLVKIYDFDRGYIGKDTEIKINHNDTRIIHKQHNIYSEGQGIVNNGKYRDLSIFLIFSLFNNRILPNTISSDYTGQLWRMVGGTLYFSPTLNEFSNFIKEILPMIGTPNGKNYFISLSKYSSDGGLHGRPDRKLITYTDVMPFLHSTNRCILKNKYFDDFKTATITKPLDNKNEIIYTNIGKLI